MARLILGAVSNAIYTHDPPGHALHCQVLILFTLKT